jgi:stage V sporulation protein AD
VDVLEQKQKKNQIQTGRASVRLEHPVYIQSAATTVGKMEGEGPLGAFFDVICDTDKFGEDTWEAAESRMQKEAAALAIGKAGIEASDLRYVFAGDLLGQDIASSFGLMDYEIPLFGLYGACSTLGEAMSLASMCLSGGYAARVLVVTSSHFAGAEKTFRFPVEYANQRPLSATWTVTGSGAYVLGTEKSPVKISGFTTGKIMDYGVRDAQNMGAAMAPAAMDLIRTHLEDFGRTPSDYDRIVTGDLGHVGQELLIKLLKDSGIDIGALHEDCGIRIFDRQEQGTQSGGSGCGCSAVTLAAYYLPKLVSGELRRILFVPTGALMSQVSFNQGQNVIGIAHGIVLEHEETGGD